MGLEELESRLAPTAGLSGNQPILQSYGQLPISFEANAGQTDAPGATWHTAAAGVTFLATGAVLNLQKDASVTAGGPAKRH